MAFLAQNFIFLHIALRSSRIWPNCFSSLFSSSSSKTPQQSSSHASDMVIIYSSLFTYYCSSLYWNFLPETLSKICTYLPHFLPFLLDCPCLPSVGHGFCLPWDTMSHLDRTYVAVSGRTWFCSERQLVEGMVVMEKAGVLWVSRNPTRRLAYT